MVTVKFTVSSLSNLFALNVSTGADSWTYESSNTSPSRTLVTVYFVNPDSAKAYLEKLDLDVLVGRVLVSTPKECKMVEGYCLSGETVSLSEDYLRKSQGPRKVDWTKPLKHLGGLQVRYVETLVARVRFKHLCVIGTENQYAALFDDQGQPEVGAFAVTNAPEVKTLRVGVTRVGYSVGLTGPQNLALTGPQNLALTWEGDKLIKAEVL